MDRRTPIPLTKFQAFCRFVQQPHFGARRKASGGARTIRRCSLTSGRFDRSRTTNRSLKLPRAIVSGPLQRGFVLPDEKRGIRHWGRALRHGSQANAPPRQIACHGRAACSKDLARGQHRRSGGARAARHRAAIRVSCSWTWAKRAGIPSLHYYDGGDKLFVPVSRLSVISATRAPIRTTPLHRLGSGQWEKGQTQKRRSRYARHRRRRVLNLCARAARKAAFPMKLNRFDAFSSSFSV